MDPDAVAKSLRDLGYSPRVVQAAVQAAISLPGLSEANERSQTLLARATRWNPNPEMPLEMLRAVSNENEFNATELKRVLLANDIIPSPYYGLTKKAAGEVLLLEADYAKEMERAGVTIGSRTTWDPGVASELQDRFNSAIKAKLDETDARYYFLYSSSTAKYVQSLVSGIEMNRVEYEAYVTLFLNRSGNDRPPGEPDEQMAIDVLDDTLQILGPERTLPIASKIDASLGALDAILINTGLSPSERVTIEIAAARSVAQLSSSVEGNPAARARAAYESIVTSGRFDDEKRAQFDATKIGQRLTSVMQRK